MSSLPQRLGIAVGGKRLVGYDLEPKLVYSLRGCTGCDFELIFVPTAREAGQAQLCGRAVEGLAALGKCFGRRRLEWFFHGVFPRLGEAGNDLGRLHQAAAELSRGLALRASLKNFARRFARGREDDLLPRPSPTTKTL